LRGFPERVEVALVARNQCDTPFEPAPQLPVLGFDAVLADPSIDAVVISSPNGLHCSQAEAALHAGKHVFCEKPLALCGHAARAVAGAAARAGRVLMAGHLTRHTPLYAAAAEIVRSGGLGQVRTIHAARWQTSDKGRDWRMQPGQGGGAPFDLLLHDYDLLQWLCAVPESVVATGHKHPSGAYQRLTASFACPDGVAATVDGGFVLSPGETMKSSLHVAGTEGVLDIQTPGEDPILLRQEGGEPEPVSIDPDRMGVDGLRTEFLEFFDAIDGQAWNRLRLDDACNAVAIAAAALAAAETNCRVDLTTGM
jgi:predicted dehydrogenase